MHTSALVCKCIHNYISAELYQGGYKYLFYESVCILRYRFVEYIYILVYNYIGTRLVIQLLPSETSKL